MINWLSAIAALLVFAVGCDAGPSADSTIYDSNPKHLWNRLNQTLFQRTALDGKEYGLDELDILYWHDTTNLVVGPSHKRALAVLDEFINSHGEKLISDPLKRALLQRDLWELFDWSTRQSPKLDRTAGGLVAREPHPSALHELQTRLAILIRRLELTTNEISALPDNYVRADAKELPDLPHDLFNTNGDWVSVGVNVLYPEPIAPSHLQSFDGHSAFSVMLHMPGGREVAIDYLNKLRALAQTEHTWIYRSNSSSLPNAPKVDLVLNPAIPQFPIDTEWALVRQMCVIDTQGHVQPTRVCESIQVRRYRQIKLIYKPEQDAQEFSEFDMDKRHGAALRPIGKEEKDFNFVHFRGQGIDLFEERYRNASHDGWLASDALRHEVLGTCFQCHNAPGIRSVLSYTGSLAPTPVQKTTDVTFIPYTREATAAISWKNTQYSWGLLQGLWLREE